MVINNLEMCYICCCPICFLWFSNLEKYVIIIKVISHLTMVSYSFCSVSASCLSKASKLTFYWVFSLIFKILLRLWLFSTIYVNQMKTFSYQPSGSEVIKDTILHHNMLLLKETHTVLSDKKDCNQIRSRLEMSNLISNLIS